MRVFSILAVGMGLAFAGFAVLQLRATGDVPSTIAYGIVAVLSGFAAFERLSHRPAFLVAALLGIFLWRTLEPERTFDLEDPAIRNEIGLSIATGWTVLLAFVAQRVSARRLREGA